MPEQSRFVAGRPIPDPEPGDGPLPILEREIMLAGRHVSTMPGRTRRHGGTLDQSAYVLLHLLEAGGPATIGRLGEVTGLDPSTLSRQTAALRRSGLAERMPAASSRDAARVSITEEGAQALADERAASWRAMQLVIADWSEADVETLTLLLLRYNRDTERFTRRVWPREDGS